MEAALNTDELVELFPKGSMTMSMIGVRNSGKSVLIQQIIKSLCRKKLVDIVLVMSGSAQLNSDYSFLPEGTVMNFNSDLLHRIWEKQVAEKRAGTEKRVFIVFDDCLTDKTAVRNEIMMRIYVQGRHISLGSAILSQYPAYITSPSILGNSDMILYSKLNRQALERLWESTSGISKRDFINISESVAGVNYTFMAINNYAKSPDPLDYLTYVRAEPITAAAKKSE